MHYFLGDKPCLDNLFVEDPRSAAYYPLERSRPSNSDRKQCPTEANSKEVYDPRFTKLDATISEYQLEMTSGVEDKLSELPLYKRYVPSHTKLLD